MMGKRGKYPHAKHVYTEHEMEQKKKEEEIFKKYEKKCMKLIRRKNIKKQKNVEKCSDEMSAERK